MISDGICRLCPRNCGVDRMNGVAGNCGCPALPKVARAALHFWEEPCISGEHGSGTVFFSGCNLHCVFCQNYDISQELYGKTISVDELASLFLSLQEQGAHNINLVTPTPYTLLIRDALVQARKQGLVLPIVYNTNGYEKVEALRALEGHIDIYLPDLKYVSSYLSEKYSGCPDYFEYAGPAILEMFRQVGHLQLNDQGIAKKGLLIRHLVLPGALDETRRVLDWISTHFSKDIHISLMCQYTPMYRAELYKQINRKLTRREYNRAIDYFFSLGLENAYIQEMDSANREYTPPFDLTGL